MDIKDEKILALLALLDKLSDVQLHADAKAQWMDAVLERYKAWRKETKPRFEK